MNSSIMFLNLFKFLTGWGRQVSGKLLGGLTFKMNAIRLGAFNSPQFDTFWCKKQTLHNQAVHRVPRFISAHAA